MLRVWCEEFGPDTFLQQTALTYTASLEGRIAAHRRETERDLIMAYHTGAFSRAAKVKPLSHYVAQLRTPAGSSNAKLIAAFHNLKARGVDVAISRIERQEH